MLVLRTGREPRRETIGKKMRFNFLSPVMVPRWLVTLKERAQGLTTPRLPTPLREGTS